MDSAPKGSGTRNILAALVIGIALAGGGYLVGLDSRPVPVPRPEPKVAVPEPEPTAIPDTVLGRAELIAIATAAADRFGGGTAVPQSLAGRRFVIRVPFGCGGGGDGQEPTGWTYDEDSETLRIRVTPVDWTGAEWLPAAIADEAVDALEGFWLPRPWTSSEQCPSGESPPGNGQPSSVAMAHFFGAESNRSDQRRGRPFEVVTKVAPDAVPTRGLQLLIEGRIADVPGKRTNSLCHAPRPDDRPTCLVAAEFERIAVINPATATELATWRM